MTNVFRIIALELSRTLLKLAMDRALRKELPAIFKRLDLVLPYMLSEKASPLQVQAAVVEAVEEKIGHIATPTQIGAVLGLYDPIKSAIRNFNR
jgi:hypothetical protein